MSDSQPILDGRTIRPSSLTTWVDCGRRWAASHLHDEIQQAGYTLRFQPVTHVGAAVGSGVHAAAAYTMEEKRVSGGLGADSEAEDRAVAEFEARSEYGVGWDDTTPSVPTAKRQLARMTRSYRRHLAPVIEPVVIETRLEADIGDGWGMSGQLDVLAGDPDNVLRDLKTGSRQRSNGIQYGAYVMLFRAHGYGVHLIVEDYIARVRIDREQPPPTETHIPLRSAVEDAWEAFDGIKRSTAEFERRLADQNGRAPHAAFPSNPASALCGERWCRAWGTDFCHSHKR